MAYTKTQWNTGDPITQEKMNHIETGIEEAHSDQAQTVTDISNITSQINLTIMPTLADLRTDLDKTNVDLSETSYNGILGRNAWTEVQRALIYDEQDPPQIVQHLDQRIGDLKDMTSALSTEMTVARKGETSLRAKIDDMDNRTSALYGDIQSINLTFTNAALSPYQNTLGFANSIGDRLTNAETSLVNTMNEIKAAHESTTLNRVKTQDTDNSFLSLDLRFEEDEQRIVALQNEISTAHESTALEKTGVNAYNSLDQRFEAIESELIGQTNMSTRLDTIEGNVSDLSNNKVNKTDIANNLTTQTAGKVLDAYQGYILNQGKINYTDIIDDVISTDIDKPLSANQGKVLKDTMDTNFTTVNDHLTTVDNMATANAAILEAARSSNIKGTTVDNELVPHTYASVDARLEDIEGDIHSIANELAMLDGTDIKDTNTKIDNLEADVQALANEIEMGHDENGRLIGAETRIDEITTEIGNAHRTLDEGTDTLDNRFDDAEERLDTLEGDLNTATIGLKARMAAAETRLNALDTAETGYIAQLQNADISLDERLDAIDGGVALSGTPLATRVSTVESDLNTASTGLKARITALESKDTILVPKPNSGSNFNNDGIPVIANPLTTADYLIQNNDDKYFYWRYFGPTATDWQLIGGAGGSGNTSGVNLNRADYEALITKEENTDYYVTETNGIHHYRWTPIDNVLTEIEIGRVIETNNIKKYNMLRVDTTRVNTETNQEEDVSYLNLYEFDYGADNTIIDDQSQTMHLRAQIELPKGGGGGATSTTVNKLVRLGDQTIENIVGSTVKLHVFYSSWDGSQSNDGTYTLKAGSTTIETGTFHSGADDETINGWKENTAGYYEFDVSNYCRTGNTSFTLTVNVNGMMLGKSWTVTLIDLHIESTAPETLLLRSSEGYVFPYTPYGALSKTLHIVIDDDYEHEETKSLSANTSGRATSYVIAAQAHGSHKIEMYLTARIGNIDRQSDSIIRQYIWYDETDENTPVIIASPYADETISAQQYSTIDIPYEVYKKNTSSIDVYYYLDNAVTAFDHVTLDGVNVGKLSYLATIQGPHTITIKVDNVYITVNLQISELQDVDVAPIAGAMIDFDPTTLSNSSENRLPSWTTTRGTYRLTTSDNFNWSDDINGGGYKNDVDGKCFIIKAGSYIDLNYNMFDDRIINGNHTSVLDRGAELKVIFKTAAVRKADAVWFNHTGTYTNKTVGIQLGAHIGWLKTDKASDTDQENVASQYPDWVSGQTYAIDDLVLYKEIIYKCIKLQTNWTTNAPTESSMNKYWEAIAVGDIPSGTTVAAWTSGTEYTKDTIVSYSGNNYKCIKDVINEFTTNPKDASSNWLAMGKIDTEILSTNSYLYLPYSEKDKIELDININAYQANSANNFIMAYEDGVPSKAYAYTYGVSGDGITHDQTIRIGSPDCDVYIYHLRIYDKSLTTSEILQNFIADGRDINEKIARYNKNCIYWDSQLEKYFTSPSENAILDPIKLAERLPDVKILMLDTPVFTVGKKDFVKDSTLRCIHVKGGKVYESRGDADNWFFQNGFHAGQGTTSDNYGQSARNVDFLFEVDGTHWPTKSKNMKNYKPSDFPEYISSVLVGEHATKWDENTETWVPTSIYDDVEEKWVPNSDILSAEEIQSWTASVPDKCSDWKGDHCKIALTSTSIPNNYFNLKVNVASSENVNNALFQERYNQYLNSIYQSPAYKRDNRIKNDMEFVPAILFVRENASDISTHNEFADTKWHFYALGNIGDSKKTDYTRAYNPEDMNEFTVENSDNNTNNGQFQSGVFEFEGHEAIETDYTAWSATKAYKTDDIVVYNGVVYIRTGEDQADLGEGETYSWVAADWTAITYTGWTDSAAPYFAPRTNPNPMDYIYPITSSQWNVKFGDDYLNRKHMTLVTEEFDGDHSFEFRYACCGDYRDGDLINDTHDGADSDQFDINHEVVMAFYEWLVTATEEQFAAEAKQWFVPEAMEFFYAFTHYYTMMDNRAKNTFWHFAQTGKYYEVSRPVEALYHIYKVANGTVTKDTEGVCTGTFVDPDGDFDATATYYTQYAFDLWAYDMDTAVGIDNNGALVFPYGKEDDDYRVKGEESSGWAFNGAGSIFWRRLKNTFASGIRTVMNNVDVNCFNSENLINQFDTFQNCFPEEIWRLDIERKYIRTFTGKPVDNSVTKGKQNPRFLTSMMQGRKKYQRRQWIRDQGVYFNSKYRLTDITRNENTIEFNIITPTNASSLAVAPEYNLKLTPYQDMYLNVTIGNGGPTPQIRAEAGKTYTIDLLPYSSGIFAETRLYIYGFNSISGLGNLAPMYPYSFTLSALEHLKVLDLGTDNSGYRNANFTTLPFEETTQLPLLETLNIKNCNSLTGTIKLNTANNIRTIEAEGTGIAGVILPDYASIETLHLPSTVSAISLYGARFLDDFSMKTAGGVEDYSGLYTLHVYDSDYSDNVDWISIASEMLEKQSAQTNLQLLKLSTATIGDIQTLDPISEYKKAIEALGGIVELSGTINITGYWSTIECDTYGGTPTSVWPNLEFDTTQGTQQTKHKVIYRYDDYVDNEGNTVIGQTIKTLYINDGATAPDIYANGMLDEMPSRDATIRYSYEFGAENNLTQAYIPYSGWKIAGNNTPLSDLGGAPIIRSNTVIETCFNTIDRTYYVKWFMKRNDPSSLVKTSGAPIPYGGGYELEAPTVAEIHDAGQDTCSISVANGSATYSIFTGWEKLPVNIEPTASDETYNIYATWNTDTVIIDDLFNENNLDNLTTEQLLVLSALDSNNKNTYNISSKIVAGTRVTYNMGHDSIKSGTLLNDSIWRLGDMAQLPSPTIQPLKAGNDAFTLAIDYCFDQYATYANQYSFAVLASCYNAPISTEGTRNGFGLFYGIKGNITGPRVGFGDIYSDINQSVSVGNETTLGMRNMVVLRHPAGSNTLYVYSGLNGNNTMPTEVAVNTLTWSNNNSNAYLNFGRLTTEAIDVYDSIPSSVANGRGTIFWSKYWNEDLGAGECKRLASWPHEKITYAISRLSDTSTSVTRVSNSSTLQIVPSIYLSAITASAHGRVKQEKSTASPFSGKDNSIARTICNSRIFSGLPVELQAIMCQPSIDYSVAVADMQKGGYAIQNERDRDKDYVFQYSAANLIDANSTYSQEDNSSINSNPFIWRNSANVQSYTFNNGAWVVNNYDSTMSNYLNMRFPYKAITWGLVKKMRVFRETTSTVPSTMTIAQSIHRDPTFPIQSGDIYIASNDEAYIYVSSSEITALGIQVMPITGDYAKFSTTGLESQYRGGWVPVSEYWTRSVITGGAGMNFAYVQKPGSVNLSSVSSASSDGLGLMYSIAI